MAVSPASAVVRQLGAGLWGLSRARQTARAIETSRPAVRALVASIFGEEIELRKRAADVARRISERAPEALWDHADVLTGLLADLPIEEARTRWHLGIVIGRIAHTREQRLRGARLLALLAEDPSNVVRCSAIEGLALLASAERDLRPLAEEIISRALLSGTRAERCRAQHANNRLARHNSSPLGPGHLR